MGDESNIGLIGIVDIFGPVCQSVKGLLHALHRTVTIQPVMLPHVGEYLLETFRQLGQVLLQCMVRLLGKIK
ncbi:hypothetical protein D3C73_1606160 [compost metagenome]